MNVFKCICSLVTLPYNSIFIKVKYEMINTRVKNINSGRRRRGMGWLVIILIGYAPIIYRVHKRLDYLERELERLRREMNNIS